MSLPPYSADTVVTCKGLRGCGGGGSLVIVCVVVVCGSVCLAGGWVVSESGGCSATYIVSLH